MAKNLVIVESPAKAKTIEGYLGKDFVVKSSFGHVRDLAKKGLAIDIEHDFNPQYEVSPDKKQIVAELKKLAKEAETVWLATDEDREGEAISWHLFETLNLEKKDTKRITFNEITKPAILKAIEKPRKINKELVDAQQARRVLDRIVGFELSPVLWKKVRPSLSAGRVQSVAVRLIVDREREIDKHNSESFYRVNALFTSANGKTLFTLNDGKKAITKMTSEQLYSRGIQWFEPTADNYMPLKSIDKSFSKSDRVLHFSWNNIATFAEKDRSMASYYPGMGGDWKADGNPGDGYRLVDVGGEPYWGDAIGQIPFAVDKFTDELESTGSVDKARQATIQTGQQFGDGTGLNSDTSNGYDNAMIRRAINWAAKRYKAVEGSGWFGDNYDLQKTNHSPNNLSKSSDEKQ